MADVKSRLEELLGSVRDIHDQFKADASIVSNLTWQQAILDAIAALQAIAPEVPPQYLPWIEITISGLELLVSFFPPTPAPPTPAA